MVTLHRDANLCEGRGIPNHRHRLSTLDPFIRRLIAGGRHSIPSRANYRFPMGKVPLAFIPAGKSRFGNAYGLLGTGASKCADASQWTIVRLPTS